VLGYAPALSSSKTDAIALTVNVRVVIRCEQNSDPDVDECGDGLAEKLEVLCELIMK
jgi:hypothetical protein